MNRSIIFLFIVFLFCQLINAQNFEKNEDTFVFFTKKISEIEELQKAFFQVLNTEGDTALFVNPLSEFFHKDTIISTTHNDKKLYFYLKKYLFFYNIYYWLEFSKFEMLENEVILDFYMVALSDVKEYADSKKHYKAIFRLEGEDWVLSKLEISYD